MPGPLIAGIAGSVGSAALQASAAKKASNAQTRAANDQIAESRRQFDLIQSLMKPYYEAGSAALKGQLDLLGLGGGGGIAPAVETIGGKFFVNGQEFATVEEARAFSEANKTPVISAREAQRTAIDGIAQGEQFGELVRQGEYGMMANAAATGGLRGGNTQAAMAQFRPQMLQALIDKQLANFGGIAANGQSAAAMTGNAAYNTGGQVNQALDARGAAQAGNYMAQGNAWQNAGSGILNTIGMMAKPLTPGGGAWQKWQF